MIIFKVRVISRSPQVGLSGGINGIYYNKTYISLLLFNIGHLITLSFDVFLA